MTQAASTVRPMAARERRGGNSPDNFLEAIEKEQLNDETPLSALIVAAALPSLPRAIAGAVLAILAGGSVECEVRSATVVRFRDGQVFLPGF